MQKLEIIRGAYYDSVTLMLTAKELNKLEGIVSSSLSMGTEANYRIMANSGFDAATTDATPSDLIIAVRGEDEALLTEAVAKARDYLENPPWKKKSDAAGYKPKSLDGAMAIMPDANLAIVSVAGQYAAEVAFECLDKGLHVMIFSDNVSLEKEIELKTLAAAKGLLVMGPDCGTAIVRGAALGMANVCPAGPVGIVAAAGTGLQEVHTQLAHRGVGTLHGIGTGGRDVKAGVGGITALAAMDALTADDEIAVVLVVGKPPAPEVEQKLLARAQSAGKPVVLCFIGGEAKEEASAVFLCSELEESAAVTAALVAGKSPAEARAIRAAVREEADLTAARTAKNIGKRQGFLRGLYSGGTLCYEAQLIASGTLGAVRSNAPLNKKFKLADSLISEGHTIVDYGEDEFTQGKLHPMIDPAFRAGRIVAEAKDKDTGVILFDVVLGYGCHRDPAGAAAEAVLAARGFCGERVAFVASVCGTDRDPQNLTEQRKKLEEAGVFVCSSNARAARLAAALAE